MIFEQIATGGCQSYLIGCADTCVGALIDPEIRQGALVELPSAMERPEGLGAARWIDLVGEDDAERALLETIYTYELFLHIQNRK